MLCKIYNLAIFAQLYLGRRKSNIPLFSFDLPSFMVNHFLCVNRIFDNNPTLVRAYRERYAEHKSPIAN